MIMNVQKFALRLHYVFNKAFMSAQSSIPGHQIFLTFTFSRTIVYNMFTSHNEHHDPTGMLMSDLKLSQFPVALQNE